MKAAPASPPARARAEVEPLTADLRRLHLTVSRRLLQKLAAARDALSHSHPFASDDEILELGLDLIVERHRTRRGIGRKPRVRASTSTSRSTSTTTCQVVDADPPRTSAKPPPQRSRHVPAAVWRAVWARDGGRCVCYGDDLMDRYTRPKGPRCSEPVAAWASPARLPPAAGWAGVRAPAAAARRSSARGPYRSVRITAPFAAFVTRWA